MQICEALRDTLVMLCLPASLPLAITTTLSANQIHLHVTTTTQQDEKRKKEKKDVFFISPQAHASSPMFNTVSTRCNHMPFYMTDTYDVSAPEAPRQIPSQGWILSAAALVLHPQEKLFRNFNFCSSVSSGRSWVTNDFIRKTVLCWSVFLCFTFHPPLHTVFTTINT